jgi:Leishmanolysin
VRTLSRRLGRSLAACALPLLLGTCEANSAPTVAATIEVTPSHAVSFSAIGASQQLTTVVKNQSGSPLTNAVVAWTTSSAAVVTVTPTGLATAVANGTAQLTATSGGATADVAVTVAQAATQLLKVSGDLQTDTVAHVLPQPLVVLVRDATAHPMPGASVSFAVVSGSGSVGTASATTDAAGQAQTTWTLGPTAGSQAASATLGALPAQSFSATATAGPPASVAKQAGDGQTTVTGLAVAVRPAVIVRDAFNNLKPGATVTFAPTAGSGSIAGGSQTTNAAGIAIAGNWTLGNPGTDSLLATVTGPGISGNPAVFTATSQGASVAVYVGNNQLGLVGYPVNVRPAVLVTGAGSTPVPGTTVTFAVGSGGGSLTGGTAITNASGVAQVSSWTLGSTPATNTLTATVTGAGIAGNPVTFSDTGVAAVYNIVVQYYGPTPTLAAQAAFTAAATEWQSIIYRHVGAPILVTDTGNQCGAGEPGVNQTVTDVLILATLDSIDGPSGILGFAGPCVARSNGLPLLGVMVFDTADVAGLITSGQLGRVILHEMGHVLGFGTVWSSPCLQLQSNPPGTIQDTYFGCAEARTAFDSLGGASYSGGNKVPVENCGTSPYVYPQCGAGTVNGHWREVAFGNELMTGYLNGGVPNPLSLASVAAQEDIGYTVNYAGAEAYPHTFMARSLTGGTPSLDLGDDIRHGPIYVVDATGTIIRVINSR